MAVEQFAETSRVSFDVESFWKKLMSSFGSIFPLFNKENIAFSSDKFIGQSKYPINLWNQADSRGRNFYLRHSQEAQKQLLNYAVGQDTVSKKGPQM